MNLGQIIYEVERCAKGVEVAGINRVDGEPITPAQILEAIEKI
jgi:2-oxoglutarate ferredoxin oxidoreductase subunit alpha